MSVRRIAKTFVTAFILLLVGCFPPYDSVALEEGSGVTSGTVPFDGRQVHYVATGDPGKPMVLFVHGTPGSWEAFRSYILQSPLGHRAFLVAVDRPGFGLSTDGDWLPTLKDQARAISHLMAISESEHKPVIVGHSLGGTIAYQAAVDFPEAMSAIVVVSSSLDPGVGKARWYNHLSNLKLFSWMMPADLRRANQEIMPLERDLEALVARLDRVNAQTVVIHGSEDKLVNFANLQFAGEQMPDARLVPVADAGHFLLWEQPGIVVREIERILDQAVSSTR